MSVAEARGLEPDQMAHCNEHFQLKRCRQRVYCGTHNDTWQRLQPDFYFIFNCFIFLGVGQRLQGQRVGMKGWEDEWDLGV